MKPNELIQEYQSAYSEWAEELGDEFPQFLVYKLASDLCRERDLTQHLQKVAYVKFTN